jgi:alpha-1,6-mannosyltransferase
VNQTALLALLGLATALPVASLAVLGEGDFKASASLLAWGIAHAFYLAAAWVATRRRPLPQPRTRVIALILAIGLIPRLALLPTAPTLSEDLYRYLWDGRLVAHGVNPFQHPPSDPSLARFRDGLYVHLNHAGVPTVYPPVAQILFAAAALLGATPLAWKGVLFVLEGALIASLLALLARRGLPPERLLLYSWNPLVVVECYGSGHLDLALAAFLLLALALAEGGRRAAAGVALGAAMLTKLVPVLLVPTLLRRRAWILLATAAGVATLLYLPFLSGGRGLWEGLGVYTRHWEFNGPLYALLRPAFRTGDPPRLILAGCLAISTLVIAFRARTLTGAALAAWVAFLLLSPTVYPWYLVPVVALLPLHPDAGLMVFSGTAALVYLPLAAYRASGAWTVPGWILGVEYGALLAAWGGSYLRRAWAKESSPT